MFVTVSISGNCGTGQYSVTCSCGAKWRGQALHFGVIHFDPALPIAEAVAHSNECHTAAVQTMAFDPGYKDWLLQYWDLSARILSARAGRDGCE